MSSSVLRGTGFGRPGQGRSSRAKTKPGGVLGSVNSSASAIDATEDAARRRFAAARACSGSVDRTQTPARAPVSNFTLTLDGGSKGLLQNNTNLCKRTLHVTADITGQNGKTANQNPALSTPCGKKKRKANSPFTELQQEPGGRTDDFLGFTRLHLRFAHHGRRPVKDASRKRGRQSATQTGQHPSVHRAQVSVESRLRASQSVVALIALAILCSSFAGPSL